jgi:hypothetical protein
MSRLSKLPASVAACVVGAGLVLGGCGTDLAATRAEPVGRDCGPHPLTSRAVDDATESAIRDRVTGFIAAFEAAWRRQARSVLPEESVAARSTAWRRDLHGLVAEFFVAGAVTGEEDLLPEMLSTIPHLGGRERITSVETDGVRATVRTHRDEFTSYVYRLVREAGAWRIRRIVPVGGDPLAPVLSETDHRRLLASVGEKTRGSAPRSTGPDLAGLFRRPTRVVRVGAIATSGVIAVHDLAWYASDLLPLAQRVPAGTYEVSVALGRDGSNRALRVHLVDVEPVTWVPADRVGSTNEVGVDAGNVAVLDFATMPSCRAESVAEAYEVGLGTIDEAPAALLRLGGRHGPYDGVLASSGHGDGGYPAFWGVAADGTLTDLVVDFLVGS